MRSTTDYRQHFQNENGTLQFIAQPEGYIYKDATGYRYVYQYKDHLGSNRLSFMRNAGTVAIVKETNYYPFGLTHQGYNNLTTSLGSAGAKKYQYNGKELQEDFGLDWYDYGARFYDATLGCWHVIDPLAEDPTNISTSPYIYVGNNPTTFIDSNGKNRDWFENEKTGEIMNVKGENKVPESEKDKDWVNIGKDDKFGEENVPNGEKGTVTKMNMKESKEFMEEQGYELRPKLSYEAIRHDFPVNTILPSGGSAFIENLSGERVVVSRTYVKINLSEKTNITLFSTEQNVGSSYTNYTKSQYNYSGNSLLGTFLKSIGTLISTHNGDAKGGGNNVKTVYDWKAVSNPKLLKLKDK
jgi:RHS repeat-associated protein